MKKILIVIILIAAAVFIHAGGFRRFIETASSLREQGKPVVTTNMDKASVIRVIDGDTIVLKIGKTKETVRLIGIDAPESVHPDEWRNVPEGRMSSDYLASILLPGKHVYLEYDREQRDRYDRLLAYVYYREAGDLVMANRIMVKEGMAKALPVTPNTKYERRFDQDQNEAKKMKKGFWNDSWM